MVKNVKVGDRFGKLEVVLLNNSDPRGSSWLCKCECGNELILSDYQLIGTKSRRPHKSCGCSKYRYNGAVSRHWRLYDIWKSMKRRCYDPKSGSYERYGAAGVTVDKVWVNDFEPFLEWSLDNGYKKDLTIDRIDTSLGYSPSNCRWVSYNKQMQSRGLMGNNTTGVTGVAYLKKQHKYSAYIQRDGIQKNLGMYDDIDSAAEARTAAEEYYKRHGTLKSYS